MEGIEDLNIYMEEMVKWRREFHANPELGFEEFNTSRVVSKLLNEFGLEVYDSFSETAVVGVLDTGRRGPVVGMRADMDALPMDDLKDVPYKSKNKGVCHACGHDVHTAILLGVAKYLAENRDDIKGVVKFVFQPAEEGPGEGGAKPIMESGILDDVEIMLGAHTNPNYPTGTIIFKDDELFAGGDFFEIKLTGRGGHGAYPDTCIDLISLSSPLIAQLQNIINREIDPTKTCILSICAINAGQPGAKNVIPHELNMSGTIRYLHKPTRDYVVGRIGRVLKSFEELYGIQSEFKNMDMFPILKNDNDINACVREATRELLGVDMVKELPQVDTGSEDFSYYSNEIPSCYFYFGVKNSGKGCDAPFHHPLFDADEECMPVVQGVFINAVKRLSEKEGEGNEVYGNSK